MTYQPILQVSTPKGAGDKKYLGQLPGASLALSVAELANTHANHTVLIVPDPQT
ncbi:transcription-repair coupling factor, partial [Vibrio vulnificus]